MHARTANPFTGDTIHEVVFSMGSSEYVVKNIDGLGPVKAPVTTIDIAADPGGDFISAQDGMRNIVLTVGFEPDYANGSTVADLRQELYSVFMPKNHVEMEFLTDELGPMWIEGWVETHEPVLFSDDPSVQISIICPYPYFQNADAPTQVSVPQGAATFSIPFPGKIPVPFEFMFNVVNPQTGVWMYSKSAPKAFYLALPNLALQAGDWVTYNTRKGERGVTYVRSFQTINALSEFRGSLVDGKLYPGLNYFYVPALASLSDVTFEYRILYGGL
jgi:hypothetical protein